MDFKTTVDWLRFRTKTGPFDVVEALRPLYGSASELVTFDTGHKPKDGWLYAGVLKLAGDITLGRIDYGGESQREWVRVNLTGEGCQWVQDWPAAERLDDVLADAEITRLDLALTTYKGEVNHHMVIAAHQAGKFSSGGRQPHYKIVGGGSDPRAGTTVYVGKREGSDKMLRCYEKGFEILQKVPETMRRTVTGFANPTCPDASMANVEDIYRVEVEFKNETKFIPWFCVNGRRDEAFAGAYPFCAELLGRVSGYRMNTLPDFAPRATLETSLDHCRRAYGPILRAALMAHGGDEQAMLRVMARVMAEQPSQALIDAGVLTVEHR